LVLTSGRAGLLALVHFFIIWMSTKSLAENTKLLLLGPVLLAGVFGYVYSDLLGPVFYVAFEFLRTGETASTNDLMANHLFLPLDVGLFGEFFWAQPSISDQLGYRYRTDSGFVLAFIAMGLPFLMLVIWFGNWFVLLIWKLLSLMWCRPFIKMLGYGGSAILVFGFLVKGPIYFSERIVPVLILISYWVWERHHDVRS